MRAKFVNESISEKDKDLIKKAWKINFTNWMAIDKMADEAETEEGREELKRIAKRKYHQEEYDAGSL